MALPTGPISPAMLAEIAKAWRDPAPDWALKAFAPIFPLSGRRPPTTFRFPRVVYSSTWTGRGEPPPSYTGAWMRLSEWNLLTVADWGDAKSVIGTNQRM